MTDVSHSGLGEQAAMDKMVKVSLFLLLVLMAWLVQVAVADKDKDDCIKVCKKVGFGYNVCNNVVCLD